MTKTTTTTTTATTFIARRIAAAAAMTLAIIALPATPASAQPDTASARGVDLEWDPSVLILRGFSAVAAYGPDALPRWRFALDVFTFAYPSSQLDDGWTARAYGGSAIVRFHPFGAPRGLWIAAQLRAGRWRYTFAPTGGSDDVFAMSAQARVGFNWFPWNGRLYVNPQIGVAVPLPIDDPPQVAGTAHSRLSPFPVPALHIGYSL